MGRWDGDHADVRDLNDGGVTDSFVTDLASRGFIADQGPSVVEQSFNRWFPDHDAVWRFVDEMLRVGAEVWFWRVL
jgi:hypothetical protein